MYESMFLKRNEEDVLFRHYERRLLDFCSAFKPPMPKSVVVRVCLCLISFFFMCTDSTNSYWSPSFFLGHCHHVLPEVLPQQLCYGAPPKDHHVSDCHCGKDKTLNIRFKDANGSF